MNENNQAGYPAKHHVQAATTLLVCIGLAAAIVIGAILFG